MSLCRHKSIVMTAETHCRAVGAGLFKALKVQTCTANLQGQNFHPDETRRRDLCPVIVEGKINKSKFFKRVEIGCCLPCCVWKLPRALLPSFLFVSFGRGMLILGLPYHCISVIHHMLLFKGPWLRAACCRISHSAVSSLSIYVMFKRDLEWKLIWVKTSEALEIDWVNFLCERTWILGDQEYNAWSAWL